MSFPNAAELARNLTTYFIRNDDIINRWGNVISSYQNLPGLVGFWPMSAIQPSTGYVPNLVPIVSGATNLSLVNNNSIKIQHYNNLIPYADLNGTTQYFSIADNTDLDITGAEDTTRGSWAGVPGLTMICWAWFNAVAPANNQELMSKFIGAPADLAYAFRRAATTGEASMVISTGAAFVTVTGNTVLPTTTWVHLAVTFDPGNEIAVFLNGAKDGSNVVGIPAALVSSAAPFNIGSFNNGGGNFFPGRITQPFLGANLLPDSLIAANYEQSRVLFGV